MITIGNIIFTEMDRRFIINVMNNSQNNYEIIDLFLKRGDIFPLLIACTLLLLYIFILTFNLLLFCNPIVVFILLSLYNFPLLYNLVTILEFPPFLNSPIVLGSSFLSNILMMIDLCILPTALLIFHLIWLYRLVMSLGSYASFSLIPIYYLVLLIMLCILFALSD